MSIFLVDEIYVNEPLSSKKIMEILQKHPNIKVIKCPSSLYPRISKKYVNALNELGVEVIPIQKKGRPKKYDEAEVELIQQMLQQGLTPQEAADKTGLPLKTIYYLKKTPMTRGRKSKYTAETEAEIKKLYEEEGLRVKEISDRLGIPLRTVYSIIKKN